MNILGPPQVRDNSSKSTRFIETELFLAFEAGTNLNKIVLDQELSGAVRVELIDYKVTGVPVTAGVPNFEYLRIEIPRLSPSATTNVNHQGSICLQLNGTRTFQVYTPPRRVTDQASALWLKQFSVSIIKPDGSPAVQGTDYVGIYLTFRVTEDQGARRAQ